MKLMNDIVLESMAWGVTGVFAIITLIVFVLLLRIHSKHKHAAAELRRALQGNLKMRLLTKGGRVWKEVIFAVNELIDRLEKVEIEASRSQAARKKMLSSISHDIRTPLTSLIGYLEAMKDDIAASGQEKQEYLEILSAKSNALKVLIDDIFLMAKLDADELPMKEEALDFGETARESIIDVLPEINRRGIKLKVLIPEEPCNIVADRQSVARIIGNIVTNALQYGGEGKVLGVVLAETSHTYELLIWDRGPGIPKEELAYVFERSYRGDQARSMLSGGSGLGLAIAKALAEKNGGTIWAESKPGEKTTFGLTFKKKIRNE